MQRATLNLLMAAALLALGALAWFKPGAGEPPAPLAFGALEGLAELRVERPDAPGFTLARGADGRWSLTVPFAAPADPVLVEALLEQLRGAQRHAAYPVASVTLAELGLEPPALTLALGTERYEFGATEPLNYRRYLRHGDQVLLVDELLHFRLSQNAANFADRRLLPEGAEPVGFTLPGRRLDLLDGRWVVAPAEPAVSADAPLALAAAWRAQRADRVVPRAAGAVQARLEVRLRGTATPLHFEVLTAGQGLRLARPDLGLEYAVPEGARAALLELAPTAAPAPAPAPAR